MTSSIFMKRNSLALSSALLLFSFVLQAQTTGGDAKSSQDGKPSENKSATSPHKMDPREFENIYPADWTVRTYNLRNSATQSDANDILVALRNILMPSVRLMLVSSDNTILLFGPPDQQQLAANLIHDLDRPKQSYRLTYTFTEYDAGKRSGIQHHSLTVVTGQRATFKEGSKIPILTGSLATPNAPSTFQQQFQYIDVGLNLDASIDPYANGIRLRTKVEQSSSVEDKPISGIAEPVIRQSVFEGTAILTAGKPTMLGSIEVPGTTRRVDIEVVADLMP